VKKILGLIKKIKIVTNMKIVAVVRNVDESVNISYKVMIEKILLKKVSQKYTFRKSIAKLYFRKNIAKLYF